MGTSTHSSALTVVASAGPVRPALPWLLALLGLSEAIVLLTLVDAHALAAALPPSLAFLEGLHVLPRILVGALAASALFAGGELRKEAREIWRGAAQRAPSPVVLALHVLAFLAGCFVLRRALSAGASGTREWTVAAASLLAAGAFGLTLVQPVHAWWRALRRHAVPLTACTILGAGAWFLGVWSTSEMWQPLRRATLAVTRGLLACAIADVYVDPGRFVLGAGEFRAQISPACSGFEGIAIAVGFLAAYIAFFRRELRVGRALLLLPLAAATAFLANCARIAVLVWIGARCSTPIAVQGFHSIAGTLASCAVALGTVAATRRFVARVRPHTAILEPTAAYLLPLMVLVAAGMALGAFAGAGLDALHPLRPALVLGTLFLLRRRLPALAPRRPLHAAAVGIVGWVLWTLAVQLGDGAPRELALQSEWSALPAAWASLWLAARIASTVIVAPLAEELAFRGYLVRRLVAADFERVPFARPTPFAWLASALLFGLTHEHFFAASICGALYALAQARGRSVGDAVLAHATTNALLVGRALLSGQWSVWL